MTGPITNTQRLRYLFIAATDAVSSLPTIPIPITCQHIKPCALTAAVSSLEAYSTPAR